MDKKEIKLTPTEKALVQMAADGKRPAAIAEERGTSVGTVETQLRTIRLKAGCNSIAHLVAILLRKKMIK